jgi:hypothetical protein
MAPSYFRHNLMVAAPNADLAGAKQSVRDRPDLGQLPKNRRVGTIRLPGWTGGIAPQVHRARFLKAAIEATTVKLLEYVVTFDCVDIQTEHRRPRIQKVELPVVCCVADLHRTLLHTFLNPIGEIRFAH